MEQTSRSLRLPEGMTAQNSFSCAQFDSKDGVNLLVGPEAIVVAINRDLLRSESLYIRGLLDSNSTPSGPGEILIPEVEESTFAVFEYWISHRKLSCKVEDREWCLPLTKAWIFAQRMGTPGLADDIIEHIRIILKNNSKKKPGMTCPSLAAAQLLWEQAELDTKLHRMFVTLFFLTINESIDLSIYPHDLVNRAFKKLMKRTRKQIGIKKRDLLHRKDLQESHASPRETSRVTSERPPGIPCFT